MLTELFEVFGLYTPTSVVLEYAVLILGMWKVFDYFKSK